MTKKTNKVEREVLDLRQPPRVVNLGGSDRAQLKDTERHLLRARKIMPRDCQYLQGDEIAQILLEVL